MRRLEVIFSPILNSDCGKWDEISRPGQSPKLQWKNPPPMFDTVLLNDFSGSFVPNEG